MIAKLERLSGEIGDLNSKLVLLVGASRCGKTKLLRELGCVFRRSRYVIPELSGTRICWMSV